MDSWSDAMQYFLALVDGDLMKVKQYSASLGVNIRFSDASCGICWFFETFTHQRPPQSQHFWAKLSMSCHCKGDISHHHESAANGGAARDDEPASCIALNLFQTGMTPVSSKTNGAAAVVAAEMMVVDDDDDSDNSCVNAVEVHATMNRLDDPNCRLGCHGVRPLHVACGHGWTNIVRHLLEAGADPNVKTIENEETPLQVAIKSPNKPSVPDVCAALVDAGARLVETSAAPYDDTPLHHVALHGPVDVLRALLSARVHHPAAVRTALTMCNMRGEQPLHCAVRARSPDAIALLVGAGSSINAVNPAGLTPLLQATEIGDEETIRALLSVTDCDVNFAGAGKLCALHIATNYGSNNIVCALLKAGADVEAADDAGVTPLMYTSLNGRADITRLLLDAGAMVNRATVLDYTALHHAAWEGHVEVVNVLLAAGARADDQTSDGNTPLALAAHGGHSEVVRLFVGLGCNVNNSDRDNDTALMYASFNGDLDSVQTLVAAGASASVCNRVGATAIWNAVYCGQVNVLQHLIAVTNPPLSVPSRGIDQHFDGSVPPCIYDMPRTPLYVAIDHAELDTADLMNLLLDVGVAMRDERWYWAGDFPENVTATQRFRLANAASNVPSLLHIVRDSVRRLLGGCIQSVVPQLDIPITLRDTLLLRDVISNV